MTTATETPLLADPIRCIACKETTEWELWITLGRKCPCCGYDPYKKGEIIAMKLNLAEMNSGGCLYVRTPTAQYWMILLGDLVAVVHRKGNCEQYAQRLEQRKLSPDIEVGKPFGMFDIENQPVSIIQVLEVRKCDPSTVPLKKS